MPRYFLILIFIVCFNPNIRGNNSNLDSTICFLSQKRLFPVVFLDPHECQIHGGSYLLSRKGVDLSLYSLVNLGFYKPIISKSSRTYSWELNFGAATFTQFDLIKKEDGSYLAGLLNNDYKLSGDISIKVKKNVFRLRVFHISSHLGDDYLLRNSINSPNDKSVNYEQVDITFLKSLNDNYWYAGLGEIYTKYVFRDRFSVFGGGYITLKRQKSIDLFASTNIKILAENNYKPDIRFGFGINLKKESKPVLKIWAEYFNGQLPYSTLEYGRINWLGLAMWVNIF